MLAIPDLAMASTMSVGNPTQRNDTHTSRQLLQRFNQNMKGYGYSQNDSILGAPRTEIIPYNDNYLYQHPEPLTMADLYR